MPSNCWFTYTWLGRHPYTETNWFKEEGFITREEAEVFLARPENDHDWRGPIKSVPLCGVGEAFDDSSLRDFKIDDSDNPDAISDRDERKAEEKKTRAWERLLGA